MSKFEIKVKLRTNLSLNYSLKSAFRNRNGSDPKWWISERKKKKKEHGFDPIL